MSVRRSVRAWVLLTMAGVAAGVASAEAAANGPASVAARAADPVRKRTPALDPGAALLQIQTIIDRMAVSSEMVPADARDLLETLTQANGRTIAEPALKTLATDIALAVAQGAWDDESIERLAQDLFTAVTSRELSGREAGLLITDVSTLLRDAGVEALSIDAVASAFRAISPAGTISPAPVARLDAPAARRDLSVLTRK